MAEAKFHFDSINVIFALSCKAGEMIDRGDNTYGGKYVVNPSGGLISKGHPLGATGNVDKLSLLFHGTHVQKSKKNRNPGCVIQRPGSNCPFGSGRATCPSPFRHFCKHRED